jgi:hypothetical protein
MNTWWQDVRYGVRMLLKNPGVTLLAVCALALGIGANAAIFSVADPLLLRPEPFPNLGRLVLMYDKVASLTDENSMLPFDYETVRAQSKSFEDIAAHSGADANLTGQGDPERVQASRVTPNFFDVVLASSGVYGVMAHSVTERTHEIGIRLALGAEPRQVLRWIAVRGMRLAGIGLAIGFAVAFVAARMLSSLLYGVSATDPLIFVGVPAALALVAIAACYLPARRAMRVDPMVALRYE